MVSLRLVISNPTLPENTGDHRYAARSLQHIGGRARERLRYHPATPLGGTRSDHERAAFERLLKIAKSDAGQSRRVASFILSWWNASSLGGFDLADLFAVDQTIAADMGTIFVCLGRQSEPFYPEDYETEIEAVIEDWRPEIWAESQK